MAGPPPVATYTVRMANDTARARLDRYAEETGLTLLTADGFDEAIVGVARQFTKTFVLYDLERVLQILMRDGLTREEAEEHFEFNIVGAFVGDATPAFLIRREQLDI
jgi:hypothetical protein